MFLGPYLPDFSFVNEDCQTSNDYYCTLAICYDTEHDCGFYACYDMIFKHSPGYIYYTSLLLLYIALFSYCLFQYGIYLTKTKDHVNAHSSNIASVEKHSFYIFVMIMAIFRILYCNFNLSCMPDTKIISIISDIPVLFFIFAFLLFSQIIIKIIRQSIKETSNISKKDLDKISKIVLLCFFILFFFYCLFEVILIYAGSSSVQNIYTKMQSALNKLQSSIQVICSIIFVLVMVFSFCVSSEVPRFSVSSKNRILFCTIYAAISFIFRALYNFLYKYFLLWKKKEIQNHEKQSGNYELFLTLYLLALEIFPIFLTMRYSLPAVLEIQISDDEIGLISN